jgi:hypothetical protein
MAFTLLQLYNRALDMVGQPGRLTSISDVTPTCEALNRAIEFVFTEFVRTHDWNWAKADVALVATTDPTFGWENAFTLPADYVAAVELNDIVVWGIPGDLYEIRAGLLLTDAATANLVYIRKPIATTSPSVTFAQAAEAMLAVMDPLAVRALSTLLASEVAPAVRQDGQDLSSGLYNRYLSVDLPRAQANDGNEGAPARIDVRARSKVLGARYGSNVE